MRPKVPKRLILFGKKLFAAVIAEEGVATNQIRIFMLFYDLEFREPSVVLPCAEAVAAHGSRDMAVWGELFRSLEPHANGIPDLRVKNLADCVKSVQAN